MAQYLGCIIVLERVRVQVGCKIECYSRYIHISVILIVYKSNEYIPTISCIFYADRKYVAIAENIKRTEVYKRPPVVVYWRRPCSRGIKLDNTHHIIGWIV